MARILWIHAKPAFGGHGGAELRTRTLVKEVLAAGHEVLLAQKGRDATRVDAAGLALLDLEVRGDRLRYVEKLRSRRPLCAPTVRRRAISMLRSQIRAFEPDVSIVSELVSVDLAKRLLPVDRPWIYEAHNVEPALFAELSAAARNPLRRVAFAVDARRFARDQADALGNADAVVAVSVEDLEDLRSGAAAFRGVVVPSSVPERPTAQPAETAPSVLFVGMLSYLPNVEAITALVRDVMPAVRTHVPEARLVVAGRDPRRGLRRELASHHWCTLRADPEDLEPLYRNATCVAIPLRTGSGTRLKTYEAMSWGVAVVGSPVAFAGIPVDEGNTGFVATGAAQMADRIVHLLRDPGEAARIGAAGRDRFLNQLAPRIAAAPLLELIDTLAVSSPVGVPA